MYFFQVYFLKKLKLQNYHNIKKRKKRESSNLYNTSFLMLPSITVVSKGYRGDVFGIV